MSRVRVEIEYLSDSTSSISGVDLPSGNNISGGNFLIPPSAGGRPFILGASPLGGNDVLWNKNTKYKGFISNQLSSATGATNVLITISGININNFTMNFDKAAEQWATKLVVNGTNYTNASSAFVWGGTATSTVTVKITEWNKPFYPVRITSLLVANLTVEYSEGSILELVASSQVVADNDKPSYGITSQYGSLTLIDHDKQILELAEQRLLQASLPIRVYLDDNQIGEYRSEKWSYGYGDNKVKVDLTDELQNLRNKKFPVISYYDFDTTDDGTGEFIPSLERVRGFAIFDKLYELSGLEGRPRTFPIIPTLTGTQFNARVFLNDIAFRYPYIESGTLLDAWSKLCRVTQLTIFLNRLGEVEVWRMQ